MTTTLAQLLVFREQIKKKLDAQNSRIGEVFTTPQIEDEIVDERGRDRTTYTRDEASAAANAEEFQQLIGSDKLMLIYAGASALIAMANAVASIDIRIDGDDLTLPLNAAHALLAQYNQRLTALERLRGYTLRGRQNHMDTAVDVREMDAILDVLRGKIILVQSGIMAANNQPLPDELAEKAAELFV